MTNSNSLTTAAQNASSCSAQPDNGCKFCGKKGLLILPLRCATLPKEAGAPELPANVGAHVKDISIGLSSYTLRMARIGYLYMLVNRKGALSWQCYISNAGGYWYEFAADTPPAAPPEFNCCRSGHNLNASMVAIADAQDVQAAYLLFTSSPLTKRMLSPQELKNLSKAEAMCAKGQMVKFNPAAWVKGSYQQDHCLQSKEVATSVPEFLLAQKKKNVFEGPLAEGLTRATFPAMATGMETDPVMEAAAHLPRLDSLIRTMTNEKAVAVAMYDHIGVTQELNDFRNDALNKVHAFLNKADKEGTTNRWKFDALQAIHEVQKGFENGLVTDAIRSSKLKEAHIRARYEPNFPDDSAEMRRLKLGWNNARTDPDRKTWPQRAPQKSAEMEAALAKQRADEPHQIERAKKEAQERWRKVYFPLLDDGAMTAFETDFNTAAKAATDLAAKRVDDHLSWVLHDRFVEAFDVYDRKDLVCGQHFEAQSALCTLGMVGIEKSAAQVDAWLNAAIGDRKNIYMRGLLLNQEDIEKEAAKALSEAGAIAAAAPHAEAISGKKMYETLKGLIKSFSAADKAWDEYVRESEKPGNRRSKGLEKTWEGAKLFKLSELNRSVARKGITGFEKKMVGFFGGLTMARMGELAEELKFNHLMTGIDPEKPRVDPDTKKPYRPGSEPPVPSTNTDPAVARDAAKASAAEAEAARKKMVTVAQYRDMQRRAGVTFTAEEYLKRKSHMTSNYHHARIGGLLGIMETFYFAWKVHDLYMKGDKATSMAYWDAVATLLGVASIGCDVAYSLAKSARETAKDTSVRVAADIYRGGWKLAAGALGAAAGGIGLILDFAKLSDESNGANRTDVKVLLVLKIAIGGWNTSFGAAAAFSYSGPLLRRLAKKLTEDAIKRRTALVIAAEGAEWLATRVLLLRLVAWGTGAGLVLTVGEIAYHVYIYYQPNELELWMKRCAFRKRSLGGNAFGDTDQELEEFTKARQAVGA